MFSNQTIFNEKKDKAVTDVVRPSFKSPSQEIVSGFSIQNNQNMRYTFKGALNNTGLHIPCNPDYLVVCVR